MPARKLSEIMGSTRELNAFAASAHRIAQLQQIYLEAVPTELAKLSQVMWSRGGVLVVNAGNAAVASKLRHVSPRVLDRFRQRGFEFNSLRIQVQVAGGPSTAFTDRRKSLSSGALSALEKAIATTPDSPLKTALEQLARKD